MEAFDWRDGGFDGGCAELVRHHGFAIGNSNLDLLGHEGAGQQEKCMPESSTRRRYPTQN